MDEEEDQTLHECTHLTDINESSEVTKQLLLERDIKERDAILYPLGARPKVQGTGKYKKKEELSMPIFENGRYKNPWRSWKKIKVTNILKQLFCDEFRVPKREELDQTLPVLQPDMSEFLESPISGVRHMWAGHSTCLVQFDGVTFITDPMFSDRCSPVQFIGVKRYRRCPCTVNELPALDFVLITTSQYDHLDHGSVLALHDKFGSSLSWYVPMGLHKWMQDCGVTNVTEMTWWQEDVFSRDLNVRVACTPSQHWSRRTGSDENKVLWCSWSVLGPKHSFHFCGATGHCEAGAQIGKKYGPFTLAALPIGAYSPRSTMSSIHLDPVSAVDLHTDVKSQQSVAIHWGTFALSSEPYMEPKEHLDEEIEKRNMKPSDFFTVNHGEIILIGSDGYNELD